MIPTKQENKRRKYIKIKIKKGAKQSSIHRCESRSYEWGSLKLTKKKGSEFHPSQSQTKYQPRPHMQSY